MNKNKNQFALILVTSLFFLWGFAHNLDPILIPHLQRSFELTTVQATLIDSAVFVAYFIMAIPAGMLMKRFGFKGGIITGLLIFSTGCFLFVPAADAQSYLFFLVALFVIACGLTILETAANPYVSVIGDPATASFRLNLAQSFNGLATSLAPIIGAKFILVKGVSDDVLGKMSLTEKQFALAAEAQSVKAPYFILGTILLTIAVIFAFTRLPKGSQEEAQEKKGNILQAFKYPQLRWAVVAQFFYVGAQVCILSLFILYASSSAGLSGERAALYLGICGIAFMVGRFVGTFLMRFFQSYNLLAISALICLLLCVPAIFCTGMLTIYSVIAISFFMSIMFPTIFALGIKGLGSDTAYGSSLIIMSIVGGAIIPRIFGYVSDGSGNLQNGYIVPLICFAIVACYGWKGHRTNETKIKSKPTTTL